MERNMGVLDRAIRLLLAAVFGILYFGGYITGVVGLILVIVGAIFLLTSLVGFCPLYVIFGWNTCGIKKADK